MPNTYVNSTMELRRLIPKDRHDEVLRECMGFIVEGSSDYKYAMSSGYLNQICDDLALVIAGTSVILGMKAEPGEYDFVCPNYTRASYDEYVSAILAQSMMLCHWYFTYGGMSAQDVKELRNEAIFEYCQFSSDFRGDEQREHLKAAFQKVLLRIGFAMASEDYEF